MSVWRAMLTPVRTYNFSNILPKRIHNHIGSWGRKQYHFETYFGHKGYEKTKNRHFHTKFSLSPKISIWRAMSAPARTCSCVQKLPLVFSKRFYNHIRARGRRQYHFETRFGHKGYEKTKNRYFHAKFPLSPEVSIWRGVNARTHLQLFSKHTLTVGIKLLPPAA